MLICPICNKEYSNILKHIQTHIKEIKNKEDFYNYFPNYIGSLTEDHRIKQENKCPYCEKKYDYRNSLVLHIKKEHPEFYIKEDKRKNAKLICPICNNNFSDIKQHVQFKHYIEWNNFCNEYNWDINLTKFISKEYKENLSKNKKEFYTTERGLELRKNASDEWKNKNPSKNKDYISKSIYNRSLNSSIPFSGSRGIKITYNNITFRSYNEFCFYILLIKNNIDIVYEPHEYVIKYYNLSKRFISTYLPDFYVNNILIELKSHKREVKNAFNEEKYIKAQAIYTNLNINFKILDLEDALKLFNINFSFMEKKYIKEFILNQHLNDNIKIICEDCSLIIKDIFQTENLYEIKNIKILNRKRK